MTKINQKAQNVIEHTIKIQEDCKLQLLTAILRKVNSICEQNRLEYFAVGKLLALCMTGEDSYLKEYRYDIGMLRKDYDIFIERFGRHTEPDNIQIKTMYHSGGMIQRLTAYLVNRMPFQSDGGVMDIEVRLYIQPFDVLPSDENEQREFVKEVSQKACEYRRLSEEYRYLRRDTGSLNENPLRIPVLIKNKLVLRRELSKQKKEYQQLICRYNNMPKPLYVGRIDYLQYAGHKYADVFPVLKKSLSDIPVMVPAHPKRLAFLHRKQEQQRVVKKRLEALRIVDNICRENGLSYTAMEDLSIACSHNLQEIPEGMEEKPWMLGLLRRDYEKAVRLLNQNSSSVNLIRSEELYPSVCSGRIAVCVKGCEKSLPQQNTGLVYLIPLDALPDDYDTKLSFSNEVKRLADNLQRRLVFEKGAEYRRTDPDMNSWKQHNLLQKKLKTYDDTNPVPEQLFFVLGNQMISMPYNEIFPSSAGTFLGQPVSCPCNPFFWHVKKDQEYTQYLAAEREKIMKLIDEISQEFGINYFAMSNLLIGAVIYHDVMPQSDQRNMDIGFLRKDFEAFVRIIRDKGKDYGITLHESLDGKGKYPLEVKYITFTGCKYSQARIRLLPFDKVPEDFYLYQGFRDEIDQKNEDYKQLLRLYDSGLKRAAKLPGSFSREKKDYLKHVIPSEEAEKIEKLAQSFNDDDRTESYMWIAFGKSKIIKKKELFPLQRVKFRDIEINCPHDTSVWQPVLDSELERQVSCIQKADLMLMEEFDKVCRKLGTGYFICGGTMLGYMRHEGFIPWDDDVDVAMLREDYDRFMKEAGSLLPDRFFLQTRETDPNIPYLFAKVRLDDTEYITKYNDKRDFHKGICLDIFPFDYLPEDEKERKRFVKEVQGLAKEHHLIARRQFPIPKQECSPRNEQERRYIGEQKELLKSYWEKNLAVSQQAYLDAATRYNSRAKELNLRTVASFVPSYTYIDLNDLLPYQRGKFESIEVSVPKRPDIFLKMQYGDYMKLPPKHMQVAHRLLRWSTWEESGEASVGSSDTKE